MQIKATEQVNSYAAFDMFDQLHFKLIELKTADQGHSEASWRLGTQFLDSYMLLFIVNGEGWLTVDGEFVELRSGTIYAAMPGQLVEAEVRGKAERSLYQMRFSISYEREIDETSAQAMMKRICNFTTKGEMRCRLASYHEFDMPGDRGECQACERFTAVLWPNSFPGAAVHDVQ